MTQLDFIFAKASLAMDQNASRPLFNDEHIVRIRQGRHPVIEKQLPIGEKYIANDVMLDSTTQQIIIITGPNMAGKSALLRQTRNRRNAEKQNEEYFRIQKCPCKDRFVYSYQCPCRLSEDEEWT